MGRHKASPGRKVYAPHKKQQDKVSNASNSSRSTSECSANSHNQSESGNCYGNENTFDDDDYDRNVDNNNNNDDDDEDAKECRQLIVRERNNSSKNLQSWLRIMRFLLKKEEDFYYEDDYFTRHFDEQDDSVMKLYALNVGIPGDKHAPPTREKTGRVYIGSTSHATWTRVMAHNDVERKSKNPKTRDAVTRWVLCLIIFYPKKLTDRVTVQLPRLYWKKAHSLPGKLKRANELIRMYNLRYYIPPEHETYVRNYIPVENPEEDTHLDLFKSPHVPRTRIPSPGPPKTNT